MQPHCQSRVGAIRRGMGSRVLELQAMRTAVAPHRQGGPTPPPGPWAVGWPRGCGLHMDTVERASLGSAAGSTQQSAACAASSPLPGSPVCHSPREGQEGGVGTGPCCRCCRMAPSSRRSVSAAARRNEERLEGTEHCKIRWCRENPCPAGEKREKQRENVLKCTFGGLVGLFRPLTETDGGKNSAGKFISSSNPRAMQGEAVSRSRALSCSHGRKWGL